jgi:hypothetical protein
MNILEIDLESKEGIYIRDLLAIEYITRKKHERAINLCISLIWYTIWFIVSVIFVFFKKTHWG